MPVASSAEEEEGPAMKESVEGDRLKASPGTSPHPRSVRKCLFGEVDHDANRMDSIRIREGLAMSCKRKWNFDFENGCPLEGQYLWTRAHPNVLLPTAPGSSSSSYTPSDCSPSPLGDGLVVGCGGVDFELGVATLESQVSSELATVTRSRIGDLSAGNGDERLATRRHRRQQTLKKYFRVTKRSTNKLQISK